MATSDFTPTIEQVASHMRARTKERGTGGTEAGTFNENTRPTATVVAARITSFMTRFGARLGDVPESSYEAAAEVASIGVAAAMELSLWPEQVKDDRSPYMELKAEFKEAYTELQEDLNNAAGANGGAGSNSASGFPSYGFPEDAGGIVGWNTPL